MAIGLPEEDPINWDVDEAHSETYKPHDCEPHGGRCRNFDKLWEAKKKLRDDTAN